MDMNIIQIVFSPTGGTQKAADMITSAWDIPVRKVDLSDLETDFSAVSLEKDDVAVIAVPSFGGRVPAPAIQRLEEINGNQAMGVLVCVYGNRAYEDTLIELNDSAEKSGFRVVAGIAAIAEHSIAHQYAAGRPDSADAEVLHGFAEKIIEKINENPEALPAPQIPGNRPYKKAGRRRSGSQGRPQLHRLRPLRPELSCSGNQQGKPERYRQQKVYFLYALRSKMSAVSAQGKWSYGESRRTGSEKSLFREKRKRAVYIGRNITYRKIILIVWIQTI